MTDPLEKPRKLALRASELAKELGLEIVGFGVIPSPTGKEDFVEVTFRVSPEAFKSQDQRDVDAQFYDLLAGLEDEEDEPDSVEDLKKKLKDEWGL
jgi:hypothetical protein